LEGLSRDAKTIDKTWSLPVATSLQSVSVFAIESRSKIFKHERSEDAPGMIGLSEDAKSIKKAWSSPVATSLQSDSVFADDDVLYFVTFTVVNWVDLFIRDRFREIFYESTNFCIANKGLEVYAYCIMTSHIHLIIGTSQQPLSEIVRDWKSFTSKKIRECIESGNFESRKDWILHRFKYNGLINSRNKHFQLWQQKSHPIMLDNDQLIDQKLDYIHDNPVAQGLVAEPEHWLHSSAGYYSEVSESFIKLELID